MLSFTGLAPPALRGTGVHKLAAGMVRMKPGKKGGRIELVRLRSCVGGGVDGSATVDGSGVFDPVLVVSPHDERFLQSRTCRAHIVP